MKTTASFLALALMSFGLSSCETTVEAPAAPAPQVHVITPPATTTTTATLPVSSATTTTRSTTVY